MSQQESDSALSLPFSPTPTSERIQILDVLRGFALLGILITNIQHFSMFAGAVRNPTLFGDLQGLNFWVYALTYTLAFQKFMPLFSMLFGAGIVLTAVRRERVGVIGTAFHFRRMAVLFFIALVHAYLIWYGDILFQYAICGVLVFPFRFRSGRFLLGAALVMVGGQLVMETIAFSAPELFAWVAPFQGMTLEEILATDLAAFQGGWLANFHQRVLYSLEGQTAGFLLHGLWRTTALIFLGMALYRFSIITGNAKTFVYKSFVGIGVGLALPITVLAFWLSYQAGWRNFWIHQFSMQVINWVGVVVSLGWMGIVVLSCHAGCRSWLGQAFAAVGRMALSNYLLHSLICTFIFYGYGLGLYGSVERVGQVGIVMGIWAFQLLISPLWLRHFRFGPAEWLWRTLSYGKLQPMRKGSS